MTTAIANPIEGRAGVFKGINDTKWGGLDKGYQVTLIDKSDGSPNIQGDWVEVVRPEPFQDTEKYKGGITAWMLVRELKFDAIPEPPPSEPPSGKVIGATIFFEDGTQEELIPQV